MKFLRGFPRKCLVVMSPRDRGSEIHRRLKTLVHMPCALDAGAWDACSNLRAVDKPVGNGHARYNLDFAAEIAAELDLAHHGLVFPFDLGHLHSMRAEDQCRRGNPQDIWIRWNVEMNFRESARP